MCVRNTIQSSVIRCSASNRLHPINNFALVMKSLKKYNFLCIGKLSNTNSRFQCQHNNRSFPSVGNVGLVLHTDRDTPSRQSAHCSSVFIESMRACVHVKPTLNSSSGCVPLKSSLSLLLLLFLSFLFPFHFL